MSDPFKSDEGIRFHFYNKTQWRIIIRSFFVSDKNKIIILIIRSDHNNELSYNDYSYKVELLKIYNVMISCILNRKKFLLSISPIKSLRH